MAFTRLRYRPAMSDSAYCMAMFDDGSVMMWSLFHYRTSLFERWGVYILFHPTGDISQETIWVTERGSVTGLPRSPVATPPR